MRFVSVMPTNLYGPGDRYDAENGHVVAALIMKIHAARMSNSPTVELWGSGTPKREFLFTEDLADACVFVMKNYSEELFLNVGTRARHDDSGTGGEHCTSRRLEGTLTFDRSKPERHAPQSDECEPSAGSGLERANPIRRGDQAGLRLVCSERGEPRGMSA